MIPRQEKERIPKESIQREKITTGKTPRERTPMGKIPKKERMPMGKIPMGRMPKERMEKGMPPKEGGWGHYRKLKEIPNQHGVFIHRRRQESRTGGHRGAATSTPALSGEINMNGHVTMETGGGWGARNPTAEEDEIVGETHQIGFGDFSEYTYVEILTYKPKYAEFTIEG